MIARPALLCWLFLLSACNSAPRISDTQTAQIWENPGSDFPTMCMILKSDGSLHFVGGFAFFGHGKWRTDTQTGALVVTLGGTGRFPTESAQTALAARPGSLVRFDEGRRELEFFNTTAKNAFLSVGGFNFFRSETCGAA